MVIMKDKITKLIQNDKLREVVMKTVQEVWGYAGTLYDNPDDDMLKYLEENKEASLWEEAWWRAKICGKAERIENTAPKI